MRATHLSLTTFAAIAAACVVLSGQAPLTLTAAHDARALQPGEIVRLRVDTSRPVDGLTGEAFERPIFVLSRDNGTAWEGLLAIDVEVAQKNMRMAVERRSDTERLMPAIRLVLGA